MVHFTSQHEIKICTDIVDIFFQDMGLRTLVAVSASLLVLAGVASADPRYARPGGES